MATDLPHTRDRRPQQLRLLLSRGSNLNRREEVAKAQQNPVNRGARDVGRGRSVSASRAASKQQVRHVLRGSNYKFQFAIGLATSDDGLVWRKDTDVGPEPGGPILKARTGENVWDNVIVGTPYVLAMDDGSFRMYYLGVGKLDGDDASKQGIGLAVSDGPNFRSWRRFNE